MPLDELKIENAAILKADVEGFEMDVLRGERESIQNFSPTIAISMHHSNHHAESVCYVIPNNFGSCI